jgi:uracil-DNA glycosylase family 4
MSKRHQGRTEPPRPVELVYARYEGDPVFDHLRAGATRFVPGEGNDQQPWVMFVGEAPGRDEDLAGRPFVGAAGMLLDGLFEHAGVNRQAHWLTNLIKYRPPNNTFEHVTQPQREAAARYLRDEVDAVGPVYVALLGNKALQAVLPSQRIGRAHGKLFEYGGRRFFPLYHPAVALGGRQPELLPTLRADMSALFGLVVALPASGAVGCVQPQPQTERLF